MKPDDPQDDPRLPAVYDAECRWGVDDDFFLDLVNTVPARRVLDLGCGTGRLTNAIAAAGHTVTGVDPDRASLEAARTKPHGDGVTWVQGTAACLGMARFDVAVMTSHVVQLFLTDAAWRAVLADLARTLVPGGVLSFDTRDPSARGWESWTRVQSYGELDLTDGSRVATWVDLLDVADEVASFTWHNAFDGGGTVSGEGALRFRSERLVRQSLEDAGFTVVEIFGGWSGESVGDGSGELVVVAHAPSS